MQHKKISFQDTRQFSTFFLDYIQQKDSLKRFYSRFPSIGLFKDQIKEKGSSFTQGARDTLHKVLRDQYKDSAISKAVELNIDSLKESNTFTVTTGHQLNLFTGPLYFIYKIVSVINACERLKQEYPKYNFVPVYWMASEDHDFDEINYFRLYGKKYVWKSNQRGAVGRFDPKELISILDEIPGDISIFREAYQKHSSLSNAVRCYVNKLFGSDGLVIIDADQHDLKSSFEKVMTDDLFKHTAKDSVEETNKLLNELGYSAQVHAREINFFYLDNNLRGRIERTHDRFTVVGSNLSFSESEIREMITKEPEKFSPNVILRPLYQEIILPNLAYCGGPAEVTYWLQLKMVFDYFSVPFPILMPRNFAIVMDGSTARKFQKTKLSEEVFFRNKNTLFNEWTLKNTSHNLSVTEELKIVSNQFEKIKERAEMIDSTLLNHLSAESKRASNSLKKIEKKLIRAEKRNHNDKLKQIEDVKDSLFPGGSPQERVDNFLNFYQRDPEFIFKIAEAFDPFDYSFNLLSYPFK